MIENCIVYIIGNDDTSSFSNLNTIQKKRQSSTTEGRNKILKTEKSVKSGKKYFIKIIDIISFN